MLRRFGHVRRDFDALNPPDPLTKREAEILRLMAGGYSTREIAEALGTAEGTVKNHASSILSELGVHDRTRRPEGARARLHLIVADLKVRLYDRLEGLDVPAWMQLPVVDRR